MRLLWPTDGGPILFQHGFEYLQARRDDQLLELGLRINEDIAQRKVPWRRGYRLATARDCARLLLHGGSLLGGLHLGFVTGRIARPVKSRRFKFQQLLGHPPVLFLPPLPTHRLVKERKLHYPGDIPTSPNGRNNRAAGAPTLMDKRLPRILGQISVTMAVLTQATIVAAQLHPNELDIGDLNGGQASHVASENRAEPLPSGWLGTDRETATPSPAERSTLLGDVVGDFGSFFGRRENYVILGLGLGTSLSVKPLDHRIPTSRLNSELHESDGARLDHFFEPGELLGSTLVQVGGAFATYRVGKLLKQQGTAELGRDLVRAQLLTQGVTQLVKYSVRRTRPDASSHSSFPSGHTSGAFATATVLQRHYGWKVGGPAFGIASYIATSRLSENKHFLSDLAFGAAIGLVAGRTVTLDRGSTRLELAPMATPGGAGVQVSVFRRH